MLVSGSGLIWSVGIDFFHTAYLIVGVALYLAAIGIALGVLLPTTHQLLRLVEHAPAPPVGAGGPPPAVMSLVRRNQAFGGVTMLLFLAIITLMIAQPGGLVLR
jgi:uncharacterized membrane protein